VSQVDTAFTHEERQEFKSELRTELAAFVSSATDEAIDPIDSLAILLDLSRQDLRRVALVHVVLSDAVRNFVRHLRQDLRTPSTSTERPRVVTQTVRGPIDWQATVRLSVGQGLGTPYVIRPALRVFDTPENRALQWALNQLQAGMRGVPTIEGGVATTSTNWISEVGLMRSVIERAREVYWLRGLRSERPTPRTIARLGSSRRELYAVRLRSVIDQLFALENSPTPEDLIELLLQRYFVPTRDWKLYEVLVALRVARALDPHAISRRFRLLENVGRVPFATFTFANGVVRIWYQSWPNTSGPSLQLRVIEAFQVQGQGTRPDVVVEILGRSQKASALLLEIKATKRGDYLTSGITQVLAYMRDRPLLFSGVRKAAVVAPASAAFRDCVPSGNSDVWVISGDAVGSWVREAVLPLVN
jgi:hypothetical protein